MTRLVTDAYRRISHLIPELAKFGVVGATGAVIDLGGTGALHGAGVGPLQAKAIAVCVATVVAYLGSRFWTFRHRENQPLLREASLFAVLNVIGLLIAEAVIGLTVYGLGARGPLAYNAASVVGTGLGTIFRYLSYKRWVFLRPPVPNGSVVTVPVPRSSPGAGAEAPIRSVDN
ncbi:MAG: GtrA family protein [Streptosporangiales bacterium]|nr:GtrA family protein [Streptosporangiales bacterium]